MGHIMGSYVSTYQVSSYPSLTTRATTLNFLLDVRFDYCLTLAFVAILG
jgi:hypothetical protein